MTRKTSPGIHIAVIPSKQNGKTYKCILIRQSFRDPHDKTKIRKKTLANITHLPNETILLLQHHLKGHIFLPAHSSAPVKTLSSEPHGHIHAVVTALKKIGLPRLISSRSGKEKDLVLAMIVTQILRPSSKLAMTSWWEEYPSTLSHEFPAIKEAHPNELYAAMDWLLKRQKNIEKKLAKKRFRGEGSLLYDLSSSYFEGTQCKMAKHGYSRDKKPGKVQVNYGLLCDSQGCPVAIKAHEGNIHDSATVMEQLERAQKDFNLSRIILVGDRGMITHSKIEEIKQLGVDWITALRKSSIHKMLTKEKISELDKTHLCEWDHPDYPGERLIACYNKDLALKSAHTRESLLVRTEEKLAEIQRFFASKKAPPKENEVGFAVGQVINQYKMKKYFHLHLASDAFSFERHQEAIEKAQRRDGIYVIRTSLDQDQKSEFECVRTYKSLAKVEKAFRTMKDKLRVRPMHHRKDERVKTHLFLSMLAYHVEWHMRKALAEFTFAQVDLDKTSEESHPVYPPQLDPSVLAKKQTRKNSEGFSVTSFPVLLESLSQITMNTYQVHYSTKSKHLSDREEELPVFRSMTPLSPKQQKIMTLLSNIPSLG